MPSAHLAPYIIITILLTISPGLFCNYQFVLLFFLRFYLFLFRQRRREGEREGEKHQCVVASHTPHTGDLACNPGTCPRLGIDNLYFLIPSRFSPSPIIPPPTYCNHHSVLCISESVSVLFVHLFHSLDSAYNEITQYLSFSV